MFILSVAFMHEVFTFSPLVFAASLVLIVFALLSCPTFYILCRFTDWLRSAAASLRNRK